MASSNNKKSCLQIRNIPILSSSRKLNYVSRLIFLQLARRELKPPALLVIDDTTGAQTVIFQSRGGFLA